MKGGKGSCGGARSGGSGGVPSKAPPVDENLLTAWLDDLLSSPASAESDAVYEWASKIDRVKLKDAIDKLDKAISVKPTAKGKKGNSQQGARNKDVGDLFEDVVALLICSGGAVTVERNIRTSTDQIDLLLKVEPAGLRLPLLRAVGTQFIGEAKCHTARPSGTMVTDFAGTLKKHNTTFGVLFVYCKEGPIRSECRLSISLLWKESQVVPFGRAQLARVLKGEPFFRVLRDQHANTQNHMLRLAV